MRNMTTIETIRNAIETLNEKGRRFVLVHPTQGLIRFERSEAGHIHTYFEGMGLSVWCTTLELKTISESPYLFFYLEGECMTLLPMYGSGYWVEDFDVNLLPKRE